jgi:hypothetical protein
MRARTTVLVILLLRLLTDSRLIRTAGQSDL